MVGYRVFCEPAFCKHVSRLCISYSFSQGISDYVPADIELVGYRVFLGNGQYFVSSDVGDSKMQWWVAIETCMAVY